MPPVATVTDAQILAAKTDGTLLVVREKKDKETRVVKSRRTVADCKSKYIRCSLQWNKKERVISLIVTNHLNRRNKRNSAPDKYQDRCFFLSRYSLKAGVVAVLQKVKCFL